MGNHPVHGVDVKHVFKSKKINATPSEAHVDIAAEYEILPQILGTYVSPYFREPIDNLFLLSTHILPFSFFFHH